MEAVDCRSCWLGEGTGLGGDDDATGLIVFFVGVPAERLRVTCRDGLVTLFVADRCFDSNACLRRWD